MQRVPPKEVRLPLPQGPFHAAGLEGAGVEVFLDTDGLAQIEGTGTVIEAETTVAAGVALQRCQFVRRLQR